ncbi:Conserved_hypothetical protein [Hexamita inflata]|uniref:Uncharacterized protein n=1 Tax=Hexamita inflata TaxID=28002 RepID=A0AA86R5U4_9EUKA|nr:Conserved hypothetical protein [Hexamita inflata]
MTLNNYIYILNEIVPNSTNIDQIAQQFRNSVSVAQYLRIIYSQDFVVEKTLSESSKAKIDELTALFMQIPEEQDREFAIDLASGVVNYDAEALMDLLDMLCTVYQESQKLVTSNHYKADDVEKILLKQIEDLQLEISRKNNTIQTQELELTTLKQKLTYISINQSTSILMKREKSELQEKLNQLLINYENQQSFIRQMEEDLYALREKYDKIYAKKQQLNYEKDDLVKQINHLKDENLELQNIIGKQTEQIQNISQQISYFESIYTMEINLFQQIFGSENAEKLDQLQRSEAIQIMWTFIERKCNKIPVLELTVTQLKESIQKLQQTCFDLCQAKQKDVQTMQQETQRSVNTVQVKLEEQTNLFNSLVEQLSQILQCENSQSFVLSSAHQLVKEHAERAEALKQQEEELAQLQKDMKELKDEKKVLAQWKTKSLFTLASISAVDGSVSEANIFDKLKEKMSADVAKMQLKVDAEKATVSQLRNEILDLQNTNKKLAGNTMSLEQVQVRYTELLESSAQLEKQLQAKTEEGARLAQEAESAKASIEQLNAEVFALKLVEAGSLEAEEALQALKAEFEVSEEDFPQAARQLAAKVAEHKTKTQAEAAQLSQTLQSTQFTLKQEIENSKYQTKLNLLEMNDAKNRLQLQIERQYEVINSQLEDLTRSNNNIIDLNEILKQLTIQYSSQCEQFQQFKEQIDSIIHIGLEEDLIISRIDQLNIDSHLLEQIINLLQTNKNMALQVMIDNNNKYESQIQVLTQIQQSQQQEQVQLNINITQLKELASQQLNQIEQMKPQYHKLQAEKIKAQNLNIQVQSLSKQLEELDPGKFNFKFLNDMFLNSITQIIEQCEIQSASYTDYMLNNQQCNLLEYDHTNLIIHEIIQNINLRGKILSQDSKDIEIHGLKTTVYELQQKLIKEIFMRIKTQFMMTSKQEVKLNFDDCFQIIRMLKIQEDQYYNFVLKLFKEQYQSQQQSQTWINKNQVSYSSKLQQQQVKSVNIKQVESQEFISQ